MHLNRLDLNLLVSLDAILSEKSVTRAAQKLSVSQSALSGGLQRLREHFEDELITRVGREMVYTTFGADLAPRARELLESISQMAELRPHFKPETSDRAFTLVSGDYVLSVILPAVIPKLAGIAPNVSIQTELHGPDHDERMARGLVDLVIVPQFAELSAMHPSAPLFEDEYVCIAWRGNKSIGKELGLDQFLRMGHVIRKNRPSKMITIDEEHMHDLGVVRKEILAVPNFELMPRVLTGTLLVATVQRRIAESFATHYPIRIIKHPIDFPKLVVVMSWPHFREHDPGSIWLRSLFIEAAGNGFAIPE